MIDELLVFLDVEGEPIRVGHAWFTQRRGMSTSFRYDDGYLRRPHAWPIDPSLPLLEGSHHSSGLPGSFRDCSPDRWGRNLIRKRRAGEALAKGRAPSSIGEVDFLLGVSDLTRQGALRFRVDEGAAWLDTGTAVPKLTELPRLLRASDAVARDGETFDEVKELLDAGSGSLGGARPKASVIADGRLHIAKFPHPGDPWDVMAWEKSMLDLAARAGIRVPASQLVDIEDRGVLIVERFDRRGERRIGYISAMTMLAAHDGDVLDHADLAEALPEFASRASADLREYWRRVAFSIAVHNTDDHLRNTGFLRDRGGWRLSPLFDVNPNPELGSARVTSVGGGRAVGDEIEGLVLSAPLFRVSGGAMWEIVREVTEAVSSWREVAGANGVAKGEIELFAPAIDDRLQALAAAISS